jgi:UDP-N-acetylmuramoyl-L-alanyl-D-glutamate--2,6-diaminopimelate ligase
VKADPPARLLAELAVLLRQRGLLREAVGAGSPSITGVAFDSRAVKPGQLFVAVSGFSVDAHAFAPAAAAAGAAALIVERRLPDIGVPQLLVSASRPALAVAAAWFEGFPSRRLGVVGITGTDGKTTTAHLVAAMLSACGLPAGLITTVGVTVGGAERGYTGHTTPEAPVVQAELAAMLAAGDRFAVVEATSHGLALDRVAEVEFDIGVLTNISHEHLDLHGTHEAYRAAKRRLFEWLAVPVDGGGKPWPKAAVINAEDSYSPEFSAAALGAGATVLTYAADPAVKADVRATAVAERTDGLALEVVTPRWQGRLELPLIGRFNALNALAAVGVGEALALDPAGIRAGIGSVAGVRGRMQRIDAGQPFTVYVDFAHTPGALAAALDGLAPIAAARGGGVISLFGSPGQRDVAKRPLMGRAAGERSRAVVLTDDDPRDSDRMAILEEIAAGAEAAGRRRGEDLFLIPDREEAIRHALSIAGPNDIVLLAGKGHESTLATAAGPIPWDEAAIARRALVELGYGEDAG